MVSVTQFSKALNQPRGGLLNKYFKENQFEDNNFISTDDENIKPQSIGLVIDYLARTHFEDSLHEVFNLALSGLWLRCISSELAKNTLDQFENRINQCKDLTFEDDELVILACELAPYDGIRRAGLRVDQIKQHKPDTKTIENIKNLTRRTVNYLERRKQGQINTHILFEGGYTKLVNSGDGDFSDNQSLYDIKVTKYPGINKYSSLQLFTYYVLSQNSKKEMFKNISYLRIFQPRHNLELVCKIDDIPNDLQYQIANIIVL